MEQGRHTPLTTATATLAAGLDGCRPASGRGDAGDVVRTLLGDVSELHRDRLPSGLASVPVRPEV
jgi:hypothetical protein